LTHEQGKIRKVNLKDASEALKRRSIVKLAHKPVFFFQGSNLHNQNYSFVVRVWLESTHENEEAASWRGSIEQVGSDCRFYFSDLDGITRFIQTQIGVETSPPLSSWHLFQERMQNGIRKVWKRLFR
jgi:hypothetical protein